MSAACRSCGAPIVWGTWATSGKPCPLDAAPTADGRLALVAGKIHHHGGGAGPRYTSHFATCEFADQHRKART